MIITGPKLLLCKLEYELKSRIEPWRKPLEIVQSGYGEWFLLDGLVEARQFATFALGRLSDLKQQKVPKDLGAPRRSAIGPGKGPQVREANERFERWYERASNLLDLIDLQGTLISGVNAIEFEFSDPEGRIFKAASAVNGLSLKPVAGRLLRRFYQTFPLAITQLEISTEFLADLQGAPVFSSVNQERITEIIRRFLSALETKPIQPARDPRPDSLPLFPRQACALRFCE